MNEIPCQNRSCKSYGKPHPNCECQYFAEGGEVGEEIPQDQLPAGYSQPSQNEEIPQDQLPAGYSQPSSNQDGEEIPIENLPDFALTPEMKYTTPMQKAAAGVEGFARGVLGPIPTGLEQIASKFGVPGVSNEDIKQREKQNPYTSNLAQAAGLGSSLYFGVGLIGRVAEAAEAAAEAEKLGQLGTAVYKGFLTNASLSALNETNKAMLGEGDPNHPVAAAIANVGIGGLLGGLFEGGAGAARSLESNVSSKIASFITGLGAKAAGHESTDLAAQGMGDLLNQSYLDKGFRSFEPLSKKAETGAGLAAATYLSTKIGSSAFWLSGILGKILGKPIEKFAPTILPTIGKWASEGFGSKLLPIVDYATNVANGNAVLDKTIESLFRTGVQKSQPLQEQLISPYRDKALNKIDEWIGNGGVDADIQDEMNQTPDQNPSQNYADGGEVTSNKKQSSLYNTHPISKLYPEQNMLLQAAKGRVSNYLKSLKPTDNQPKLAFDPKPDTHEQDKKYRRALQIAAKPLTVLDKIKHGSIQPEDIQHLNSMYPEVSSVLQQKLTKRITEAQLKNEKPNYTVRQGLSLLMGTPLSSEFTPQNIQAAQAVFMPKQAQQQPQGQPVTKNKKSTSSLTKYNQAFLTGNQALAMKQQKEA